MPIEQSIGEFINSVGFPIAAFVMMMILHIKSTKQYQILQEKGDERYEKLVNCFIESMKEISKGMKDISEMNSRALADLTMELKAHIQEKDKLIQILEKR